MVREMHLQRDPEKAIGFPVADLHREERCSQGLVRLRFANAQFVHLVFPADPLQGRIRWLVVVRGEIGCLIWQYLRARRGTEGC